jgi:glycosyltransferase involved in cell wall biosynthesis
LDGAACDGSTMILGFACTWDRHPVTTWSHTPWNLREALRQRTSIADVGIELGELQRSAYKAAFTRRRDGRWVTTWKYSELYGRYSARTIERLSRAAGCDAVLQIQDLAPLDLPFFVLQDSSFDVLLHLWDESEGGVHHFEHLSLDLIRRRRERQQRIYQRAAGVLALSQWFADSLVRWSGVPKDKVHVVYPGLNTPPRDFETEAIVAPPRPGPRRRLLFVGKDFRTKGGPLLVRTLALLRKEYDPTFTLTIAGPDHWPLPDEIPPGITYLGRLPVAQIQELYEHHDLFVMPSKFEAFGIAFVEALAHGLPCVGRNAFAMPELIHPGVNGDLADSDDPGDLAAQIVRLVDDDGVFETCRRDAPAVAARFTWNRAADDALRAISSTLS